MTAADLWKELEADQNAIAGNDWIVRRIQPNGATDLRLGICLAPKTRALLVRVPNTAVSASIRYPPARGFKLDEIGLADCPRTHTTLGVCLTDVEASDIFSIVVDDIVQQLATSHSAQDTVTTLISRLELWQWFMERAGAEGLNAESQRGLFGELLFLRDMLIPRLGPLRGVEAWTGPSGAAQDFQWSRLACEVKVTIAKQLQKMRISNELQLDTRAVEHLVLFHLSLDARQGSGETLGSAIDSVRAALSSNGLAVERFKVRLIEAGYHEAQAARYENVGYTVRDASYFNVTEGFPRIVEQDLRRGVGDVAYSISVAECQRFTMSPSEVEQLIEP